MRQVLSISLPQTEVKKVKSLAKKKGFKNFSAYISHLIKEDENLISEDELVKIIKQGDQEYAGGKTKILKSLKDLV